MSYGNEEQHGSNTVCHSVTPLLPFNEQPQAGHSAHQLGA